MEQNESQNPASLVTEHLFLNVMTFIFLHSHKQADRFSSWIITITTNKYTNAY